MTPRTADILPGPDVVVDADVLGRNRTGDETHVRELLTSLGARDDISVGAVSRDPLLVPTGIAAYALAPMNQVFRLGWQLPRLLSRLHPRLAHFQYVVPPLYRGRSAVTVHDLSYERLPELEDRFDGMVLRALVPRAVRRAVVVFTVSEWSKADIVDRYGVAPEKVVVTLNGVSPLFRPGPPPPGRSAYLLFVGALRPRKDPLTALEAYRRLAGSGLDLVMVGPDKGLGPAVDAFVQRHGLQGSVHVLGHVSEDELAGLYRGAECMLLPTLYEGFGLPVIEAMASGAPVVTTDVGAIPEVAGGAAVLVPPRDPEALAGGIQEALGRRSELVTAGLARSSLFNWETVAQRVADGYRSALA